MMTERHSLCVPRSLQGKQDPGRKIGRVRRGTPVFVHQPAGRDREAPLRG